MLKPVVLTCTAHAITAPTAMRIRLTPRPMTGLLIQERGQSPLASGGSSCEDSDQRQERCHDQHEEEELRDRESANDAEQDKQDDQSQEQRHSSLLSTVVVLCRFRQLNSGRASGSA